MVSFSYNPNPPTTEVDEYPDPDTGQKTVAVKNTGEVDAMVRVNVFSPDFPDTWGVKVKVVAEGDAAEWTQDVTGVNASGDPVPNDEGWLYWPHPVAPGESTPAFTVEVTRRIARSASHLISPWCSSAPRPRVLWKASLCWAPSPMERND